MIVKWVLTAFALAALALYSLTKLVSFLNPPRAGRLRPPLLRHVERTLRWTVIIPAIVGLAILALTLFRAP